MAKKLRIGVFIVESSDLDVDQTILYLYCCVTDKVFRGFALYTSLASKSGKFFPGQMSICTGSLVSCKELQVQLPLI